MLPFSCFANSERYNKQPKQLWEKQQQGVTFSLKQIFPDQVKAFYIGRGFSIKQIKPYADTCIFRIIFRNNTSDGAVHFKRKNWQITYQNKVTSPPEYAYWEKLFISRQVQASSLIAFRFAQIPMEQVYESNGDWNQGMLSVNLPLGSQFDIAVLWDVNGEPHKLSINEIQCIKQ